MTQTGGRPALSHSNLPYRDAPAALRFLAGAIGFSRTMPAPDGQGGIAHAELRPGDVAVVVSDHEHYDGPQPKGDTIASACTSASSRQPRSVPSRPGS